MSLLFSLFFKRCLSSSKGGLSSFRGRKSFSSCIVSPSFERSSPLTFTDWITTKYGSVQFYNTEMEAYYHQVVKDLSKYYSYSEEDAVAKACHLPFFRAENFDMVKQGIVTQEPPFYYATQLALSDKLPRWKHETSIPDGYEYCNEFKMLAADKYYDSYDSCKEAFGELGSHYIKKSTELFHGTEITSLVSLKEGVKLYEGRGNLDFDCNRNGSFYLTRIFEQAKLWAFNVAKHKNSNPVITVWELDVNKVKSEYQWKIFEDYDEWVEFVKLSRSGENKHQFDVVEGPFAANPRFYGTIQPLIPVGHQVAICSENVAKELKFVDRATILPP